MNLYRVGQPYGTLMVVVKRSFEDRESGRDLDHLSKSPVTITDWAVAEGLNKYKSLVSVKWRERMYSEEAYHSTMNSYNSLMVSHQKS